MYFFMDHGKQCLSLKDNLILSRNPDLVYAKVKSASPVTIALDGGQVFNSVHKRPFWQKVRLVFVVIGFLWGKDA